MRVFMKIMNEEGYIGRCLDDFHDEPWVDEIVIIDGGSTDYTVHEAKHFDKVKVFVHPYLDWYHAAETMQANVVLTYAHEKEIIFLLDADERMSGSLKALLSDINEKKDTPSGADLVHIPRKTFDLIRHPNSPFCVYGPDGWPIISHQIGQFPDYQPRLLKKHHMMHWVNPPHRVIKGWMNNYNIPFEGVGDVPHIIHYEKDDFRKRQSIERRWLRPHAAREKLGMTNELYECGVKPEYQGAEKPDFWKDGR